MGTVGTAYRESISLDHHLNAINHDANRITNIVEAIKNVIKFRHCQLKIIIGTRQCCCNVNNLVYTNRLQNQRTRGGTVETLDVRTDFDSVCGQLDITTLCIDSHCA